MPQSHYRLYVLFKSNPSKVTVINEVAKYRNQCSNLIL